MATPSRKFTGKKIWWIQGISSDSAEHSLSSCWIKEIRTHLFCDTLHTFLTPRNQIWLLENFACDLSEGTVSMQSLWTTFLDVLAQSMLSCGPPSCESILLLNILQLCNYRNTISHFNLTRSWLPVERMFFSPHKPSFLA